MVRALLDPHSSIYHLMAYYLRFLRTQQRLTQTQVGTILGCTKSQVSKYEGGRQLDAADCAALDAAWNTGGLFTILLGYAKLGVDPNWPARLGRYQRRAIVHKIFSINVIPIPFQTEDYARSLLEAGRAAGLVDDVDAVLAQRMELQAAILDSRPQIWAIIDEVGLRPMGSPDMMAAQRRRLLELGTLSHVSIRVLPLAAAPHIGLDGAFWCFTLPERRVAAFSGAALHVGRLVDDQAEATVAVRFDRIAARAWSEDQSREHISGMSESS